MTQKLGEIHGHRIVYPDDGHALEFYPFLAQVKEERSMPYGQRLGGHYDVGGVDDGREAQLAGYAADLAAIGLPDPGASAFDSEGLGVLIEAIALGRRHVHVVNVENRGVIPNLPDYA